MELPEGCVHKLIKEVLDEEGFLDYRLNIEVGSKKGDNYLGQIYRVDVIDCKDETKKLHLIVKCSTRNKNLRLATPFREMYKREAYVYNNILPAFKELQTSLGVENPFSSYAKLYKCCTDELDEVLIMDNKKEDGYVMKERLVTLDFEDCKLVLEELGHFHALSIAMKKLKPDYFKELTENYHDILYEWCKEDSFRKQIINMGNKAENSIDKDKYPNVYEKFHKININIHDHLMNLCDPEKLDDYWVVSHGDCWTNNMLFRFKESETLSSELCFLDWQISLKSSPARDLSDFLYNCTGTELRKKCFDNLIQVYYNSLRNRLEEMGCDAEELFPFSALQSQMKKYFRYGLIIACFNLYLFTSDQEEIPDMEIKANDINNGEHFHLMDTVDFESKNIHLYNERISGCIRHAVEYGFI